MNSVERMHIVMLPFMAQGHLIPFLALARQIEHQTGYAITIVNTPLNIQYLQSSISSETTTNTTIRLAELHFCSSNHGLPPDSENTDTLPHRLIINLLHASQSLQPSFHRLLSNITDQDGRPPLCIISDVFFGWAVDVAKSLGTLNIAFSTCGAYGTAAYISLWLNLPHRSTDADEFPLPGFPETCRFYRSQLPPHLRAADGTDAYSTIFRRLISLSLRSNGLLCNTVEELEPLGLGVLRKITGLPVWAIGPLLPPALFTLSSSSYICANISNLRAGKESGITPMNCVEWLNLHPPNSVLYISFGSQNTITASQMIELAMGVEASGKRFIWVVRPPVGFDIKGELRAEWLPEGFEERVTQTKQGLVVREWAPQLEILSHKSTRAFLSHCGWNSVLESLSLGVPIIGWPLAAEQAYNSKMMEEMGVCVELARGTESTIIRGEVERVIKIVMGKEGKGVEMKKKAIVIAKKVAAAVTGVLGNQMGSSIKALDDFLDTVQSK